MRKVQHSSVFVLKFIVIASFFAGLSACDAGLQEGSRLSFSSRPFRGAEIVSHREWIYPGDEYRVVWRARPAQGNCIVSLFSLFNADRLFDPYTPDADKPPWSEIAFETFGGSVGHSNLKHFQTQVITWNRPDDPPTRRGRQHVQNHMPSNGAANIFDGAYHDFEIIWRPKNGNIDSYVAFYLNGRLLRENVGGTYNRLAPPLKIYAAVLASRNPGWGCTTNSGRPDNSRVDLSFIKVYQKQSNEWRQIEHYRFSNDVNLHQFWRPSSWGFDGFDGYYSPDQIIRQDNHILLNISR